MFDNTNTTTKADYDQLATNICWHGTTFLKSTSEDDRLFDSAASAVVDTYARYMDHTSPTNMLAFNAACDAYRAKVERGSNRVVISRVMESHFRYLAGTRDFVRK